MEEALGFWTTSLMYDLHQLRSSDLFQSSDILYYVETQDRVLLSFIQQIHTHNSC